MAGSNTETANPELAAVDATDADVDGVPTPLQTSADGLAGEQTPKTDDDHADTADEQVADKRKRLRGRSPRRLSISVSARSLLYAALIAILLGAAATFACLYIDARGDLDAQATISANNAHAEKVALDYAVNAATMNFQNLNEWKTKLVAGTSPELKDRLTEAAESMQQIVVPLKWTSTAQPLTAKVHSDVDGVYVVDCFVSVQTKTVQASDALQSTATYRLTIDSNKDWQITDVGGIGALVGQK